MQKNFLSHPRKRVSRFFKPNGMPAFAGMTLLLLLAALPVNATQWTVDQTQSKIEFAGTHAGNAFTGAFGTWDAAITFDPANLGASKATVTIQLGSAKTGNALYDNAMPEKDWFNAKEQPMAEFTSTSFTAKGDADFVVFGTLDLRGKKADVTLPVSIVIEGETAAVKGETVIDRRTFGIGMASDPEGKMVSPQITLKIDLKAARKTDTQK